MPRSLVKSKDRIGSMLARKTNQMFSLTTRVFASLVFVACQSGRPTSVEEVPQISIAIPLNKTAQGILESAEVVVTAPDIVEIRIPLEITGSQMRGTVRNIPVGSDRRFTINAYDGQGILAYTGSSTVNISADETADVRIVLRSVAAAVDLSLSRHFTRDWGSHQTTLTLEIRNEGGIAATDVVMVGIARNADGAGLSEGSASVGTVPAHGVRLFVIIFNNTDPSESDPNFLATVDYSISSAEGFLRTDTLETIGGIDSDAVPVLVLKGTPQIVQGVYGSPESWRSSNSSTSEDARITGEIENTGGGIAQNVTVTVTLRDPNGNLLGRVRDSLVGTIEPSSSEQFVVFIETVFSAYGVVTSSYQVEVTITSD
jgi:hypothetical protein